MDTIPVDDMIYLSHESCFFSIVGGRGGRPTIGVPKFQFSMIKTFDPPKAD